MPRRVARKSRRHAGGGLDGFRSRGKIDLESSNTSFSRQLGIYFCAMPKVFLKSREKGGIAPSQQSS